MTDTADTPLTTDRLFDLTEVENQTLSLAGRFVFPPFTVLDGRGGPWQSRKRQWLDLGITSVDGRTARTFAKGGNEDEVSKKILAVSDGISVFDPVMCELVYRWFSPPGGTVLDPFAGGSVRGITAAILDRTYYGIDLRQEQVDANIEQDERMYFLGRYQRGEGPAWIVGDSDVILTNPKAHHIPEADLVFSCPPYHDLEQYSKDPDDLSNMKYDDFVGAYRRIIHKACANLKEDRFAAFVVGEIRDKKTGLYRNFVGDTVNAFIDAGLAYYNEALWVNPAATLALRAARQFVASRKMGRNHQTLLVFVKGDPKRAAEAMDPTVMDALLDGDEDASAFDAAD